ncbi:Exosome complex RNA-binding protein Rrp4 containing S1 and KH domain [Methanonatronarchaeum thermophilum]|uniref:Exosome complex component Rrp4 n=1 Tax=Methanonatronarchaeum thermophilum TaxID=1927129 RepID=A0A1Y3GJ99_9EURY|nr:exosome complex RNA-binding protein Rrp4 [Methanonatronarchaeum thermophilum]OUJ19525.1 Exosome complex RNA-binding protein Rrp4 containing S1 and KH domain [Methanonatronarchaeum thermophilum]
MVHRETVIPGEKIGKNLKPGKNTYKEDNNIYSSIYGFKNKRNDTIEVLPIKSKYIPKKGDKVIGIVTDISFNNWFLNINSPYDARLPVSLHPEYIESGDLKQHLKIGDAAIIEIVEVDKELQADANMDGKELKKITKGTITQITPTKVPRVIGKNASMISMLKRETDCQIYVGQNGRIWIDGEKQNIEKVTKAIQMIEQEAHKSGLTNKIKTYLKNQK